MCKTVLAFIFSYKIKQKTRFGNHLELKSCFSLVFVLPERQPNNNDPDDTVLHVLLFLIVGHQGQREFAKLLQLLNGGILLTGMALVHGAGQY